MDEWEARMRKATTDPRLPPTVCKDFVSALACIDALRKDAERYRLLRRGQHWSVIDGLGDTLRADALDAAIDAKLALHNAVLGRTD